MEIEPAELLFRCHVKTDMGLAPVMHLRRLACVVRGQQSVKASLRMLACTAAAAVNGDDDAIDR
jgi:hypothetical protein